MEEDLPPIDLEALDRYLGSDTSPDDCMLLSDLDGFLTAIVVGPELIPPSEWLPVIWGGEEPEFESEAEMRTIIGTIMGRYNQIAACFDSDSDGFDPIFLEAPGGEVIAADWAAGFVDAVRLRPVAWQPLINHRRAKLLLIPIMLLGDGSSLDEDPADWAMVAKDARRSFPLCVSGIRDFWLDYRSRRQPQPRRGRRSKR